MSQEVYTSIKPIVKLFLDELMSHYLGPLYKYLKENPKLIKTAPGFLLNHNKLIVYVGRTHIGVEYVGSEVMEELEETGTTEVELHDYTAEGTNLLEKIIGFEYDSSIDISFPLPPVNEDLLLPTNKGWDKLFELRWNVSAQNSIAAFNTPCPMVPKNQFTRIVNGFFFNADDTGLITRHIKWLDFIPVKFDGKDEEVDSISFTVMPMNKLVEHDANYIYPLPEDYKYKKLPKINRFIELWGSQKSSEPQITSFLAEEENQFILTMRFGAVAMHHQLLCEWQSEQRNNIQPDFFIVHANGFADIVEFKLPEIGKSAVVGIKNREAFAAWLASYIAQTRVYSIYFDDPSNRKWFETKYGFKVYKPRRWLVVGRRSDFDSDVWREIVSDYKDLDIITYDDLVDGVVAQFYR